MIPNTSKSVNTIQHHLPSREGKKEIYAFPIKGSNRHRVMVLSEYPKILNIVYHIFSNLSRKNRSRSKTAVNYYFSLSLLITSRAGLTPRKLVKAYSFPL